MGRQFDAKFLYLYEFDKFPWQRIHVENTRGVFKTLLNIYDEHFLRK